jgi:eukaryotic-like serine/threonine-protein kinase
MGGGAAASPPVRVGEIIAGKYRVERLLGVGAMGIVVAATHVDLHELRAVKLMLPSMLGDVEGVERFLREARAVSKLRSRHVAAVFDIGRMENGAPFIVMEYLEGADLKALLAERGVLAPGEAAAYVSEACEALAEAHAAGIIHRDIKPANLFVATHRGAAPTIKVLDFGIAKMAAAPGAAGMEMTSTKEILGTPLYMSPEQMRSMRSADARSDVWSLGVILYRALTGVLPFKGETLTEICMAVLTDLPPRPSSLRPDLPPGLDAVILGCLEKDPARRIGGAAELAIALAPFVTGGARPPLPSFEAERSLASFASASTSSPVGDATNAATLVWKPAVAESTEKTASRASWARTERPAPARSRPWLLGAIGLGLLTVALAILGGLGVFARPSAAPVAVAAAASTAPLPSAPSLIITPAQPINDPPAPSASAIAAPPTAPAKIAAKTRPATPPPAARDSAPAKAPPAAPAAPTVDSFGGGRY